MNEYQSAVREWVLDTFGQKVADDVPTRCFRFFEEAGELCQSLGMTKEDALKLVEYTWGRPVGDPHQELGGVAVTLNALATPVNLDVRKAGWIELGRCWEKQDKIREKQKSKAALGLGASPLPGSADMGKWVTLQMAIGSEGIWLPQQTQWRIIGEQGHNWLCVDDSLEGMPRYSGEYLLPKHVCSEPRESRYAA